MCNTPSPSPSTRRHGTPPRTLVSEALADERKRSTDTSGGVSSAKRPRTEDNGKGKETADTSEQSDSVRVNSPDPDNDNVSTSGAQDVDVELDPAERDDVSLAALRRLRHAFIDNISENKREALSKFLQQQTPPSEDADILGRFQEFRKEEVKLSGERPEHLVSPSGTLSAVLGLLLHWPTFTGTSTPNDGTTADMENPCMRLLFRKGLDPVNCLWLDRYARRVNKVESPRTQQETPMDYWSPELRHLHETFSEGVMNDSAAKVWVIFGKRNKAWYSSIDRNREVVHFKPLGSDVSTSASLEYHPDGTIRRVVIFCYHPEYIYWCGLSGARLEMDQALNLGAALTDLRVNIEYFDRFSRTINAGADRMGEVIPLHLVEAVMGDLANEKSSTTPLQYDQINPLLREWLHKRNVGDQPTADKWRAQVQGDRTLLAEVQAQLFAYIDHETAHIDDKAGEVVGSQVIKGYRQRLSGKFAAIQRIADPSKGDPLSLRVFCNMCKTVQTDHFPMYMIEDGAYVLRMFGCHVCPPKPGSRKFKNVWMHPVVNIKKVTQKQVKARYMQAYPNDPEAQKHRDQLEKESNRRHVKKKATPAASSADA